MINGSYGIAFDINQAYSIDDIKRGLHSVLSKMYGNYYYKPWKEKRVYLEVTTQNVFVENKDLTKSLFHTEAVLLEHHICQEFKSSTILAFYLNDSTGDRGFSLFQAETQAKRIWMDSDIEINKNSGQKIIEENFINELSETIELDGNQEYKVYHHKDFKNPMYGQRGIIEKVIRRILLSRFMFDYEWQEYKGDIMLVDRDDIPIQDLYLLYGN